MCVCVWVVCACVKEREREYLLICAEGEILLSTSSWSLRFTRMLLKLYTDVYVRESELYIPAVLVS